MKLQLQDLLKNRENRMIVSVKRRGALIQGVKPNKVSAAVALSNQYLGLRLRPYKVRLRRRYVLGGVIGHLKGGGKYIAHRQVGGIGKMPVQISRFGKIPMLHRDGKEKTHFHLRHSWGKTVRGRPVMLV